MWFLASGKDITKTLIASPEQSVVDTLRKITQAIHLKNMFGLTSALTNKLYTLIQWTYY